MKLIKKESNKIKVSNQNREHNHYWVLDEEINVPPRVLEFTVETLGSAYSLYPLLYQLATKAELIIELGIDWGKPTFSMLWGLKNGKQGHLWSIDCGNIITEETVNRIIKSNDNIAKYFTWIKNDFFEVPDEWFKTHKADLIFIDFNSERKRPEEVYKSIYQREPHLNRKNRGCRIMIERLLLSMDKESLLVMKPYDCNYAIYEMIQDGLIEIVYEHSQELRFTILKKKAE